jgi:pyruvate dehydrogenase E1 component
VRIPITDAVLEENPYLPPLVPRAGTTRLSVRIRERRAALGGCLPSDALTMCRCACRTRSAYAIAKKFSGKAGDPATTMAFAHQLGDLLGSGTSGHRIVPIIPDEARTFGMDAYFPTAKIYNPSGQR